VESITKNRQSAATLRTMIARAYGDAEVPERDDAAVELGDGWFNVAYRVALRSGRTVVLKIAPPADIPVMSYERGMMRNELAALALVQEHTDVPVPAVDHADLSHEIVDADWFAMPFVEGDGLGLLAETGRLATSEREDYEEQLGAVNRRINEVVGTHFGPLLGAGSSRWREAFAAMIDDVLNDGERIDVDLGWAYDEVRAVVADHLWALDDVAEPRLVEWDLWPANVIVRDGRIVSVIDHERAFFGDPLMEGCFTALSLPSFGDASAFVRGYGRGPLTDAEQDRRLLYTLYLVLVMVIETRYRGHEDPGQYHQSRARLDEVMARYGRTR
jgi:aminoglycoside phosphotransferase (APT) family kinase protein